MPKKPRFKAILFDFGGVLTSSPFDAFNRYEIENGIPPISYTDEEHFGGISTTNVPESIAESHVRTRFFLSHDSL